MSEFSHGEVTKTQVEVIKTEDKFDIAEIEKKEGKYTVLYGDHNKEQSVEDIPLDATSFMMETGVLDYVDKQVEEIVDLLEFDKSGAQFNSIMRKNNELKLPIYFTDARPPDVAALMLLLSEFTPFVKAGIGTAAIFGTASEVLKHKEDVKSFQHSKEFYSDFPQELVDKYEGIAAPTLSRRDLVKLGGKALVGAWLFTPLVTKLIHNFLYEYEETREKKTLDDVNNLLHPDERVLDAVMLTARNLVMAHKEQLIMEADRENKNNMVSILGAEHYGIEGALTASPEERMESLEAMKPLLKIAFRDSTFYSYAKLTPEEQVDGSIRYEKTITEVSELRELLE